MKKYLQTLFVFILVAFFMFDDVYAQIDPASPEYETLKSSGRIPIPAQVELNVPIPTIIPTVSLKKALVDATSNLLIPLDMSTFNYLDRNDDYYTSEIALPFDFDFYGTIQNSCWINNNGNISFDGPYEDYTATGFPIAAYPMLAPFWADVDTRNAASGLMWYKIEPHRVIVIWDAVGYYNTMADKLSTFELIFTDGTDPLIGIGNNVAFSYGDMQWTTGSASDGSGGFGGVPATVGVNKGDGTTFALVGRFDHEADDYDGPGGNADGVSYLDNKNFFFNTSTLTHNNIPPVASGFPASPIIINAGEVWIQSVQFLSPELGQTTATVVNDGGLSDFTYSVTSGSVSQIDMQITGTANNVGSHTISFTATDDGIPVGVTTVYLEIIVICENPTTGGEIGNDQNSCGEFDPDPLTNISLPSEDYTGILEYKWQYSNDMVTFFDLENSNSETYDPGLITETTSYKRLARVTCQTGWIDAVESNVIVLTVTSNGQWLGITSDWNDASNWCGGVPTSTTNVTIPSIVTQPVIDVSVNASCNNITIEDGAILTIESNASGTGSLIISGEVLGAGSAAVLRYMTTEAWHIVASPVSGQTIDDFLAWNPNIAEDEMGARGMMDYNPEINDWNNYFTNGTNGTKELKTGKGFSMRTNDDIEVTFTGTLQTGNQTATDLDPVLWNCVGNPYTSAIGINQGSSSEANFLTVNTTNLDPEYGAIYVWDQPDANNGVWGIYTVISNAVTDEAFDIQQGQAFMVKMNSAATSVSFNSEMQIHNTGLGLKSTKGIWSSIKLRASINSQKSSTTIAFNSAMTKGLDPTYDAGLLRGGSDLVLYSKLIEDNGIPFAIQALPDTDFGSMIIPLGVECKIGGEIIFSAENINLPADCQIILEDKQSHTFTDLSTDIYATTIAANSSISDRFVLHTSNLTTKLGNGSLDENLSAYAVRNTEIRIKGSVSNQAVATLYDVQGRVVLVKTLEEGRLNVVRTPNIKSAIYLLSVNDNRKIQQFKIPVNE